MPISFPLDFSALILLARVLFIAEDLVGSSRSDFTFHQQLYDWQADLLRLRIEWPPCERADAEEIIAKLLALRGRVGTFEMRAPGYRTPRGSGGAQSPVVMGAHAAGVATLSTDGWTSSTSGLLKSGDWFQLEQGGYKRLHKVLQAASSNVYGAADLEIWPRLRAAVADNAPLTLLNPVGTFCLSTNERSWDVGQAMIYGISVDVEEVLR